VLSSYNYNHIYFSRLKVTYKSHITSHIHTYESLLAYKSYISRLTVTYKSRISQLHIRVTYQSHISHLTVTCCISHLTVTYRSYISESLITSHSHLSELHFTVTFQDSYLAVASENQILLYVTSWSCYFC